MRGDVKTCRGLTVQGRGIDVSRYPNGRAVIKLELGRAKKGSLVGAPQTGGYGEYVPQKRGPGCSGWERTLSFLGSDKDSHLGRTASMTWHPTQPAWYLPTWGPCGPRPPNVQHARAHVYPRSPQSTCTCTCLCTPAGAIGLPIRPRSFRPPRPSFGQPAPSNTHNQPWPHGHCRI